MQPPSKTNDNNNNKKTKQNTAALIIQGTVSSVGREQEVSVEYFWSVLIITVSNSKSSEYVYI